MPVATYFPTSHTLGTNGANFLNPINLYTNNTVYTTVTSTAKNITSSIKLKGFGISIPSGSTINSVAIATERKMSTTASIQSVALQAYKGAVAMGTKGTSTLEPATDTVISYATTGVWTAEELATIEVQLDNIRGNSITACTISYDYVSVTVDYTLPNFDKSITVIDTNGDGQVLSIVKSMSLTLATTTNGDIGNSTSLKRSTATATPDSVGFIEEIVYSIAYTIAKSISVSDTSGFESNSVTVKSGRSPPLEDSSGFVEAVSIKKSVSKALTESLGIVDTVQSSKRAINNESDSVGFVSTSNSSKGSFTALEYSIGTEQLSTQAKQASVNVISENGSISATEWTFEVTPEIENKFVSVLSDAGVNDVVVYNKSKASVITSEIGIVDNSNVYKSKSYNAYDTIGINDQSVAEKTSTRTVDNTIGSIEIVGYYSERNVYSIDTIGFNTQSVTVKRDAISVNSTLGTESIIESKSKREVSVIDSIGFNVYANTNTVTIEVREIGGFVSSHGFIDSVITTKVIRGNVSSDVGAGGNAVKHPFKFTNVQDRLGVILISRRFAGQPYRIKSRINTFAHIKNRNHVFYNITVGNEHRIVVNKETLIKEVKRDD